MVIQAPWDGKAIIDFYPGANLGDDLFLHTLVTRYPNVLFRMVVDGNALVDHLRYENLEIVRLKRAGGTGGGMVANLVRGRMRQRAFERMLMQNDCLVVIGGSIFIQPPRTTIKGRTLGRLMVHDRKAAYESCPHTYVLGANFGPYQSNKFLKQFTDIFAEYCTDVCFRDRYSYELFSELANVRQAPDILFSTPIPRRQKEKKVFISVIDLNNRQRGESLIAQREAYETWVMRAAQWFEGAGYQVTLCSFCKKEGDEEAVNRIAHNAQQLGFSVGRLFYRGDIASILEEIAGSDVVIATRFHAMVLGIAAGAKVLPVPYSEKMNHVLDDIGFDPGNVLDIKDIDPDNLRYCKTVTVSEPLDITGLIDGAESHFKALDRYFNQDKVGK